MSGAPKALAETNPRPEIEVTAEMIVAGVSAIEPFDLQDAIDGALGQDELVTAIYLAMYRARPSDFSKARSS